MTVCAFLTPDKIQRKILIAWLKNTHPEYTSPSLTTNKHLGILWQYSLINYDDQNISIHRLVQAVLRDHLKNSLKNQTHLIPGLNLQWCKNLLNFFIENESTFEFINTYQQFFKTRKSFKKIFTNPQDLQMLELDLIIAPIYFYQGKYKEFLRILLNVDDQIRNKKGLYFLKSRLFYLYSSYFRKMGNYAEAAKRLKQSFVFFQHITPEEKISPKDLNNLRGILTMNDASLAFWKIRSQKTVPQNEIKRLMFDINKAIKIFQTTGDMRNQLRSIELYGRLLVSTNKGEQAIAIFQKYKIPMKKAADPRTKMLFFLTYSDAYATLNKYKKADVFLRKASQIAQKLKLLNEIKNIDQKRLNILAKKNKF